MCTYVMSAAVSIEAELSDSYSERLVILEVVSTVVLGYSGKNL